MVLNDMLTLQKLPKIKGTKREELMRKTAISMTVELR